MTPDTRYTVRVGGVEETGPKELFLRRRTAREICESGLSCGCGDFARVFIERIGPMGFAALLVDAAEISTGSLSDHFSGHSVVAIRPREAPAGAPWWLVDSTNQTILSRDWPADAKSFEEHGAIYWIGYCGPLEGYPAHNAEELKGFYAETLARAPREFLSGNLYHFEWVIDPSLVGPDGAPLNPRVPRLEHLQERIFAQNGIRPTRTVAIRLVRGQDDSTTRLEYSRESGWVARLGLRSGCSPSLISYFEQTVRRREAPTS